MKTPIRSKVNAALSAVPSFGKQIPIGQILGIVESFGFRAICEDGSPFSAIFCGKTGRASIEITDVAGVRQKECIQLQWWGEDVHGRPGIYEVNSYVL
jgi:hypothetical protein